ncbi:extracellular matrix organizing protein FRAS1-like [Mercenaria mercenaria]|uniref:extracellular matrix organizing protein FRAS1-like n=1 Tax=Mercenaria mercenaria TaxID=6596 RepID=UPI00234F9CA4|nr:extracellular matrix organizing protein FRAS1-like [Mercenaria mercenaria]
MYKLCRVYKCRMRRSLCSLDKEEVCGLCCGVRSARIGGGDVAFGRCMYKGKFYRVNDEWVDGCDYKCKCVNGQFGSYRCVTRCPTYRLQTGCVLKKFAGECCALPDCTGPGGGGCVYKGKYYGANDEWVDGCDYNGTCVNGQTGFYRCVDRCPTYKLPSGCVLRKPKRQCCGIPDCAGTEVGTGSETGGNTQGCFFNNTRYQQGQTWKDGCKFNCQCVNGATGEYRCKALCFNWQLPSACHLDPPAAGKCCQTPNCPAGYTLNYPPGYDKTNPP